MKKLLIIQLLAIAQCACAAPGAAPAGQASLLGFDAIAAEIAVSHEELPAVDDLAGAIALNIEE